MKTKLLLLILALGLILNAYSQNTIELTFSAINSAAYVQLDSIKVMNRTQGGDTVLYYPDTVLILDYQIGISEIKIDTKGFQVFQNYPNPMKDQTTITLYVPEKDNVRFQVTDIIGSSYVNIDMLLDKGYHSFQLKPGSGGIQFFAAYWKSAMSSIKIINSGNGSELISSLEYLGIAHSDSELKLVGAVENFSFNLGDKMLYIGCTDTIQSGILDTSEYSETHIFQFASNMPCPGTPTVEYEGQIYNTVQIFNQCWLKENLNVGTMISGDNIMEYNGVIEKYCYNNEQDSCIKYGGLYQWNEMMQYVTQEGVQGICPPGWHVPTDEEWKVLEGTVDSQFKVGNPEWDETGSRGFDAAISMKTTSGWMLNYNGTDLFGFSGLPGGARFLYNGVLFEGIGSDINLWSSTTQNIHFALDRGFGSSWPKIYRNNHSKYEGYSVRCLKNE